MSQQYPQVLEGVLDDILSGVLTETQFLRSVLLCALRTLDQHNDVTSDRYVDGRVGGLEYSNHWTQQSQIDRLKYAVCFLIPKVGASITFFPKNPANT